tara:strand:- start:10058 stop:10417 length:360 start_codon:yes stop_codon:yes gene_type:complete
MSTYSESDTYIFEIIDIYKPTKLIRNNLLEHLKKIKYNPEYISFFTGQPININTVSNKFNAKNQAMILQLHDYLASLYKCGDPITKGEEWQSCNNCSLKFASKGGLDLHIKYKECINLN